MAPIPPQELDRARSRREVIRFLGLASGLTLAGGVGWLARSRAAAARRTRVLMGTEVHLTVLGTDREAAESAADDTLRRMADLETILSRHRTDSALSRLVRDGALERAPGPLLDVLRLAERFSRLSDGAFDVTVQPVLDAYRRPPGRLGDVPSPAAIEAATERVDYRRVSVVGDSVALAGDGTRITLDGIAKGWIVDRGVETLRAAGFRDVFVEAGGDLVASGRRRPGGPWRVGIRAPRGGFSVQARLEASDRAVATSGDYMQPFTADYAHHHIVDPRTGRSGTELASSTVVAPDAATADALATLTLVLGARRGRDLVEGLPGCEAYFVGKDLEVVHTSGFRAV